MNLLPITGDLVRALGWTILHAIWQAFFVYACLRIVLKLWPMASARIKYNLSFFSLAGIFTWFLVTLYQQLQVFQEARELVIHIAGAPATAAVIQTPAPYPSQDQMVWFFPDLETCFPILVSCYMAGIVIMTIKFLSDLFQLHQIRTTQVEPMGLPGKNTWLGWPHSCRSPEKYSCWYHGMYRCLLCWDSLNQSSCCR